MQNTGLELYKISNLTKIKDPVGMLKEHFGKLSWNVTVTTGVHNKCCFKVKLLFNGNYYSDTGTSLVVAKKSCAIKVLADMFSMKFGDKVNLLGDKLVHGESLNSNSDKHDHEKKNEEYIKEKIRFSHPKQTDVLPLTIVEIKDDKEEYIKENNVSKRLQNLSNLPLNKNSNLEDSNILNLEIALNKSNHENSVVKGKSENQFSSSIIRKVPKNKLISSMDLVKLQTVEMELCIKNFARNPIQTEDLSSLLNYESIKKSQVSQQKFAIKRRRSNNSSEILEQPLPKKRLKEYKCSTVCKIKRNKTTSIGKNWSQQNLNPVMSLKQMYPNLDFNLEAEMGSSLASYFMMSAMIGGRKFFGHGKTKQLAEKDVAIQILNHLEKHPIKSLNCSSTPQTYKQNLQQLALQDSNRNDETSFWQLPSNLADIIETKVMQRYDQLTRGRQEIREYKVVAGIVMTFNMDFNNAEVVSIATGTKCVNGGNICCNGSVLNDSHAEIIAKRGLMKFLYTQLKWHCQPNMAQNSIFQRNFNCFQVPYSLKPNVHFHLYINTAPCGDARIFSVNNQHNLIDISSTTFNNGHGLLRTKVEGGIGTTPVGMSYYTQTWDGVLLGEPLLTMSCSDKIARWNVVGLQGALLSQLIEPIYLHSIVLGNMFNANHMYRAICDRIQCSLGYLPKPYRLNRPILGQTSTPSPRNTYRVPSLGINWTLGDNNIEIISLPTGRRIYNETSFLSKQVFFSKFNYLMENLPNVGGAYTSNNYAEAKENARDFQVAKRELFAAFHRSDLGNWIKKPIEQNEFTMY